MAADARKLLPRPGERVYCMHYILVAVPARVLRHRPIGCGYLNGLVEPPRGECQGVVKAVLSFVEVLAKKIMRGVAIVAGGYRLVARFCPGIQMPLHDVAIRAGCRIVRQVGAAFSEDESVRAYPHGAADQARQQCRHQTDAAYRALDGTSHVCTATETGLAMGTEVHVIATKREHAAWLASKPRAILARTRVASRPESCLRCIDGGNLCRPPEPQVTGSNPAGRLVR